MRPSPRHLPRLLRTAPPAGRAAQFAPRRTQPSRNHSAGPPNPPNPPSSSVNATEISHFSALASSWWDPHGPSRPLHLMNPLRHDFIQACLGSTPTSPGAPLRYLDVGCGGGIFAESAARHPSTASVTAIDPSATILAVARAHAKRDPSLRRRLTYLGETIESLPLPSPNPPQQQQQQQQQQHHSVSGPYDVVTLFEVIEHVDYPAAFLARLTQFVAPGGWLVLSTIARTWTSWVTTNLVAEDILGMVPKGTHDWSKYVNEGEMREWFAKDAAAGGKQWGVPRVMGVVFVPGLGWREVRGSEKVGNYFFGVQRLA
ncbi:hexaprenyldihydroxybenzoate methyltransferase [Trichocladium antarcticum]|uniref:Ubiquinone biosynthesis O-methyltransferase, mitochondrial n=1 Tax=Trichocladium antarcticum TaxID=1450529 RepID=A0AAN6UL39_9PEZI|nr:hexaprenyldihydroxybenzoate methyltransferase [Trichocladium antarcticum]